MNCKFTSGVVDDLRVYLPNHIYDLHESLVNKFVRAGLAKMCDEQGRPVAEKAVRKPKVEKASRA